MYTLQEVEEPYLRRDHPYFGCGDTVALDFLIEEGGSQRTQRFAGLVIKQHRRGLGSTFTVRRVVRGYGVERIFPLHSPLIRRINVLRYGKVRRAKLFYIRQLRGKKARIAELKPEFISVMRIDENSRGASLERIVGPKGELLRVVASPKFTSCYWPVSDYGISEFLDVVKSTGLAQKESGERAQVYLAFNDGTDSEEEFDPKRIIESAQKPRAADSLDFVRVYGDGLDLTFDLALDSPREGLLGAFLARPAAGDQTKQVVDLFFKTALRDPIGGSVERRFRRSIDDLVS